ncbi:hypothetical protein CC1G_00324 [Coprinopsis cinerea okayama7|uniref:Uncharacterized protein n=1 Tax=Coprinopsis cinerea (strain Okayama-7 / 130 / ATCC MYA-4618 / FGSC 9003) TaxID=240176 RepID=A8NXJ7_COPC7|nr:hypothetical protein CC1G_00324 [Coprinopsis cinerea okayama7\|eukprot:XP_001837188.2 hypothetical protein CC1G_00324 [Coprinopsis cinerea okayama7\
MIDRLLAPGTHEANAHNHFVENWFNWHTDHPSMDEALLSGCASYRAFERYLSGQDLFLLPRSKVELESILRRYAYDAIHNAIAQSRSALQTGGYSRICYQAEKSIREVLKNDTNVQVLLALHRPSSGPVVASETNTPLPTAGTAIAAV